ncbi:RIKEN cDNA 1700025K23, isoform CRA_b [Mus musculus]|nr:RIKEN cDNA 1700025K23, isoform CRA_b [Mus musculus]
MSTVYPNLSTYKELNGDKDEQRMVRIFKTFIKIISTVLLNREKFCFSLLPADMC